MNMHAGDGGEQAGSSAGLGSRDVIIDQHGNPIDEDGVPVFGNVSDLRIVGQMNLAQGGDSVHGRGDGLRE